MARIIPPDLRLAAAARLVGEQTSDPLDAGRRFLESARTMKLDLSRFWGISDGPAPATLRQVALAIIGAGKTAMLFVSGPPRPIRTWVGTPKRDQFSSPQTDHTQRVGLILHACQMLKAHQLAPGIPSAPTPLGQSPHVSLVQALLEAHDRDIAAALTEAGFLRLGDLAYMTRSMPDRPGAELRAALDKPLPARVRLETLQEMVTRGVSSAQVDEILCVALERSYQDTLDCPELCGLRSVSDVLASHKAVGAFDPSLWSLVWQDDEPHGCMLFTVSPEQHTIELVYLGLSPALRGNGLGAHLLRIGLARLYETAMSPEPVGTHAHTSGKGGVTCAVDSRNEPAVRLYRHAGFQKSALRIPLVLGLG